MIRLHAQFLHLRSTTDVLTFVLEDSKTALQVELYVCVDQARRQAAENGVSVSNELVRLCVHGTLHALGFDDHAPRDKARMWRRQEEIVAAVFA